MLFTFIADISILTLNLSLMLNTVSFYQVCMAACGRSARLAMPAARLTQCCPACRSAPPAVAAVPWPLNASPESRLMPDSPIARHPFKPAPCPYPSAPPLHPDPCTSPTPHPTHCPRLPSCSSSRLYALWSRPSWGDPSRARWCQASCLSSSAWRWSQVGWAGGREPVRWPALAWHLPQRGGWIGGGGVCGCYV